ncbi:hypothetical protein ACTFIW_000846, partial [Dictyostelium discoideum]
ISRYRNSFSRRILKLWIHRTIIKRSRDTI